MAHLRRRSTFINKGDNIIFEYNFVTSQPWSSNVPDGWIASGVQDATNFTEADVLGVRIYAEDRNIGILFNNVVEFNTTYKLTVNLAERTSGFGQASIGGIPTASIVTVGDNVYEITTGGGPNTSVVLKVNSAGVDDLVYGSVKIELL